jgi:hypothetical protein
VIEAILKDDSRLVKIDDTWVLLYQNREYVRLPDAKSREDAEQQIAEMLFLRKDPVESPVEAPAKSDTQVPSPLIPTRP